MDASADALGYRARSNGLRIGGGVALSDSFTFGGAIGYEDLSADDRNGMGRVDGDSVQVAGYAQWRSGPWRFGGAAEFGYGGFDTRRVIALDGYRDIATGSSDSWHAGLHGRAAWHRDFSRGWLEPRLDLSLIHVRTGGFTEEGNSPFNLTVDNTSDTVLLATPALAVGTTFELTDDLKLKLSGSVGYSLMSDDAWSRKARFVGGVAGFTADTPLPDRLWKVGLGAEVVTTGNLNISANNRGDFASGYSNQTAELRLDYRF